MARFSFFIEQLREVDEMVKIYVTKYALTSGITEHKAKLINSDSVAVVTNKCGNQYFRGKDFHLRWTDAIERAEEMRIEKLKSLDKQIRKISSINFNIETLRCL